MPVSSEEPFKAQELDECVLDSYPYGSFGVGPIMFIPNVGLGYRERFCQWGWDAGISLSTIGYAHQFSVYGVGHYYYRPLRKNSGYFGLGLMGSGVFNNSSRGCALVAPDFVFGKALEKEGHNNRHFIEMHVAIPSMIVESKDSKPI
jgi:hypothetical protein